MSTDLRRVGGARIVTEGGHAPSGGASGATTFEFSAGSISLCLVDTVGQRGGDEIERLRAPDQLDAWLRAAGLVDQAQEISSAGDLRDAHALRDATYRAAIALMRGEPPDVADIERINRIARLPPPRPQWRTAGVVTLAARPVRAVLSAIAADAIAILSAPLIDRVRVCCDCRMVFVDRSPAGRRQWCSSASGCGNRAKVRRHRTTKRVKPGN